MSLLKLSIFVLSVCALLLAHALPCTAESGKSRNRKLIVVVANRLVLSDIDNQALPHISKMIREGVSGLLSPNCVGPKSEAAIMLTAGAGASCRGASLRNVYDANELVDAAVPAADAYRVRTGFSAPKESAVFLDMGSVLRANAEVALPIELGACGEAIRRAGNKTCAVGNSDAYPDSIDRSSAILAMDAKGMIDVGHLALGGVLCGPVQDIDTLAAKALDGVRKANFVVVDFGDTSRIDDTRLSMSDAACAEHFADALCNLDRLIGRLMSAPEARRAGIILVSFSPPQDGSWNRLTPIVMWNAGRPGIIDSPTTRTPGLMAASDFAPTVLHYLHIEPGESLLGRAALPGPGNLDKLRELDTRATTTKVLSVVLLWTFVLLGAVAFSAAIIILALRLNVPRYVLSIIRTILLIDAASSFAMLVAAAAPAGILPYSICTFVIIAVVVLISIVPGQVYFRKYSVSAGPILGIFALTTIAVLIDALMDGTLCKYSVPSCYQFSGLRFYGIGNEYSALLLSMSAGVCIFLRRRWPSLVWTAPVLGIIIISAMGMGGFGANYGATIAATVTFGLLSVALYKGKFSARHVIGFIIIGVALVMVMAFADWKIAGAAGSHAGRATSLADKLGVGYLLSIVSRKTLLNLRIMVSKNGVRAFMAFLLPLVLWSWRIHGSVRMKIADDEYTWAGLKSLLYGVLVAFLFNDSGVVMASIMLAMAMLLLIYALLEKCDLAAKPDAEARVCRE